MVLVELTPVRPIHCSLVTLFPLFCVPLGPPYGWVQSTGEGTYTRQGDHDQKKNQWILEGCLRAFFLKTVGGRRDRCGNVVLPRFVADDPWWGQDS